MSVKLSRTTEIAWGKTRQGHKTSSSFIFNHGTRTYRGIQKTLIFIQDIQGDSENKNLAPEHTGGLRKHESLTRLYRGSRKHESTTTGPWHTGDPENPNLQPRDHDIQEIQKHESTTTGPGHTGGSRKHESTTTGPLHTGDPENIIFNNMHDQNIQKDPENINLQPRDQDVQEDPENFNL